MNRNKTAGVLVGTGLLLLTIAASAFAFNNTTATRSVASDYSLTLDNENGISGSNVTTNQNVSTDSGNYQVAFAYNKCSSLNNGHATILGGGSIKNADHILSIHSINATFSTSGVLKYRTSYDGVSWGTYATLNSGVPCFFNSNPYYVEFATDGASAVQLNKVVFSYTCEVNPNAQGLPTDEIGFTATDSKKDEYNISNVFDTDNGLEVKALYSDGSDVLLSSSQYSYSVKNNNGVVINTAQAFANEGTYYLTVSYMSYAPVQIELTVTPIQVINVTLNTDLVRLKVGETAQLTASVNPTNAPNQAINWTSSNTSILTVSATGLVTAKAVGTASVTASSVDGNKTAVCDFYVKAQPSNSTATITPNYSGDFGVGISYKSDSFTTNGITLTAGQFGSVYGGNTNQYILYPAQQSGAQAAILLQFNKPYIIRGVSVNAKYYSKTTSLVFQTNASNQQYTTSIRNSSNTNYTYSGLTSNTTACTVVGFFVNYGSRSGGVYLNSITFTLYDAEDKFPTQIYLNNTDCSLGYTAQLEPTFYPEDTDYTAVTWASSNTNVATVSSSGLVYGVAEGTATITASLVNEYGRTISGSCQVNVHTVAAEGVSVYAPITDFSIGQSTQYYSIFTPSDTTNQNVTWSSSNSNVASVSASGLVTGVSGGSATITATSVDGGFTSSVSVTVKNEQLDDYTILIYMCASDLESDSATTTQGGQATRDITEILSVSCPSNVNVVLETGGTTKWSTKYNISATKIGRYHVNNKSLALDAQLDQANMGDYETFRDFLEWGLTTYPAKKTGVIMWDHGGAMEGCCQDDNYDGDTLLNSEVVDAVYEARILSGVNNKLEFIAYDVCLMQVQDIAEFNSYNFNYMIASQESESGTGYDYDQWLPTLYNNAASVNTATLLTKIADTFMNEQGSSSDQTQSVLDLSKMPAYYQAFEALAAKLRTVITSATAWNTFATLVDSCQKYGAYDYNGSTYYLFDVFDVSQLFTKMQSSNNYSACSSELTAVRTAFSNLVVYERHGSRTTAGGLSFFCPISGYAEHYYYDSYETNFTNWRLLCETYGDWYQ